MAAPRRVTVRRNGRDVSRVVVRCCGADLLCEGFTTTCGTCGADFNMSGDRLAPREQWGEETGETASDILRGGDPFDGEDY